MTTPQHTIAMQIMGLWQRYSGTKTLKAVPMTRGDYNLYRGWTAPQAEDPADLGYLVEYEDGGKANDERHAGYISWSPADVFERSYRALDAAHPVSINPELPKTITIDADKLTEIAHTAPGPIVLIDPIDMRLYDALCSFTDQEGRLQGIKDGPELKVLQGVFDTFGMNPQPAMVDERLEAIEAFYLAERKYAELYNSDDATPRQIAAASAALKVARAKADKLHDAKEALQGI